MPLAAEVGHGSNSDGYAEAPQKVSGEAPPSEAGAGATRPNRSDPANAEGYGDEGGLASLGAAVVYFAMAIVAWANQWSNALIMCFTAVLTWVTWRQHKLESRLAAETGDALGIARTTAMAALESAAAAKRLATQAVAAERADLAIRVELLPDSDKGNARLTFLNVGRTTAYLETKYVELLTDLDRSADDLIDFHPFWATAIRVGHSHHSRFSFTPPCNFVAGYAVYKDVYGDYTHAIFILEHLPSQGLFHAIQHDALNARLTRQAAQWAEKHLKDE